MSDLLTLWAASIPLFALYVAYLIQRIHERGLWMQDKQDEAY